MLKIGDKVIVTKEMDMYDNIRGLEGIVVAVDKDISTQYLVDFGQGFNGHNGMNNECKTATAWYMMANSITEVK